MILCCLRHKHGFHACGDLQSLGTCLDPWYKCYIQCAWLCRAAGLACQFDREIFSDATSQVLVTSCNTHLQQILFNLHQAKCSWVMALHSVQVLIWTAVWLVHLPGETGTYTSKRPWSHLTEIPRTPPRTFISALATSDQLYGCYWTGWPNTVKRMASLHCCHSGMAYAINVKCTVLIKGLGTGL